jgi:hypothetical protein
MTFVIKCNKKEAETFDKYIAERHARRLSIDEIGEKAKVYLDGNIVAEFINGQRVDQDDPRTIKIG